MSTSSPSPEPTPADDDVATGAGTPGPADEAAPAGSTTPAAEDDAAPAENGEPAAEEPVHRLADVADPSQVRRAPRYGRFVLAGLLLGALISFGLTFVPGANDDLGRRDLFFLLLLSLGSLGIVLGLVIALLIDRRSMRRGR